MNTHIRTHKVFPTQWGQTRLFVSANGSSLLFQPHLDCYTLDWSTNRLAVLALRSVLEHELTEGPLGQTTILYGKPTRTIEGLGKPSIIKKFFELTDAYEREPLDPANQIDFARFDFPTRAISLANVEPDFSEMGICHIITRTDGQSLPADIEAMRRAFLDTAEDSLKPELNWALQSINS